MVVDCMFTLEISIYIDTNCRFKPSSIYLHWLKTCYFIVYTDSYLKLICSFKLIIPFLSTDYMYLICSYINTFSTGKSNFKLRWKWIFGCKGWFSPFSTLFSNLKKKYFNLGCVFVKNRIFKLKHYSIATTGTKTRHNIDGN